MPDTMDQRPACSEKNAAVPDEVKCDNCGAFLEMWSDEPECICSECGDTVAR